MTLHTLSHCLLAVFALCYAPLQAASHPDVHLHNRYSAIQSHLSQQGQVEFTTHTAFSDCVLGYTDEPVPADTEMPSNLLSWLQCVQEAADFVALHPDQSMGTAQASNIVISPLLGNIKWNQSSPWSDLCPSGTPVGCVATAMAQVLYYYRYPEHGFGSHTYTNHNIRHSVNFGETYYQWDLMFDYDNGYRNSAQCRAVAELSYHCGVAIDMDYAPGGSGAWTERIPARLHEYFGYNSKAATLCRNGYTYQQWCSLLIRELQNGRPVVFAGTSSDVGHCFVIDGVNAEGLFHVNWGWGGYYNGYFDIGILEPEGQGIGGSAEATLGFCLNQRAVVQLCPEEGGIDYCPITCDNFGIWWDGYGFSTGFTYQNNSAYSPHAILGLDVANAETGEVVHTSQEITKDFGIYPTRGYWTYDYFSLGHLDVPDGYYELRPYCIIPANDSIRYDMHTNLCSQMGVYVEGGAVMLWERSDEVFDLAISNFVQEDVSDFALGRLYEFEFDVTNTSGDVFVGTTEVYYYRPSEEDPRNWPSVSSPDIKLLPGQSQHITIPVVFDESGDFNFAIAAYSYPFEVEAFFEETQRLIHVDYTADSPAQLTLAAMPQLLTEHCEVDGEISFRLVLDNAGGNFSNKLAMQFFSSKTAVVNPSLIIADNFDIEMGANGHEAIITGQLTGVKGMFKYYVRPYYRDQRSNYQPIFDASGKVTPLEVRVNNASGIESIHTDPTSTRQYDLLGRPVREGHRGPVIVN